LINLGDQITKKILQGTTTQTVIKIQTKMAFIDYYKSLKSTKATDTEIKRLIENCSKKIPYCLNLNDKQAEIKFKNLTKQTEVVSNPEIGKIRSIRRN
jgi:hypothetical protein